MAEPQTPTDNAAAPGGRAKLTFPDPSITIVEFGDALGVILASRTDRDAEHRRLVLKKCAYVRFTQQQWGAATCAEVWIEQDKQTHQFRAVEAKSGKIFRHPTGRRYEVAFITRDLFDCAVNCLKERDPQPLMELILVTFSSREGFEVKEGALSAPSDYANITQLPTNQEWVPTPQPFG